MQYVITALHHEKKAIGSSKERLRVQTKHEPIYDRNGLGGRRIVTHI